MLNPPTHFQSWHPATLFTLTLTLFLSLVARAQSVEVMHNFGVTAGDGNVPSSGLIVDAAGNYYGVTRTGGAHNAGIVYQLSPVRGGGWNETILYNFKGGASDGSGPSGLLLRDSAGNLYGTAQEGGLVSTPCTDFQNSTVGCGIVFKLARTTTGQWTETVLHRFTGGTDGGNPNAGLVRDKAGNLYGTAAFGGVGKAGTVFKLSHTTTGWKATTLHAFVGTADGINPLSPLVFDSLGNLYGTTYNGGPPALGIVFKLLPQTTGAWKEQVLHTFQGGPTDGQHPFSGGVTLDKGGDVYGSTFMGGPAGPNGGTVFKLNAANGYAITILHNFSNFDPEGSFINGSLLLDAKGTLWGTSAYGVFGLTPGSSGWSETVLWGLNVNRFPSSDGVIFRAPVIMDAQGNFYGTTLWGGQAGNTTGGVGFKLVP
jgi:uncharacterized repeat protein (TIGR03803 family)